MVDIEPTIVFRVVNCAVGVLMIIGGIAVIISLGFPEFIRGTFCILFGIVTGLFEFRLPLQITQYASFMFSFLGRGLFYIFIGAIILNYGVISIIAGSLIIITGIVYSAFEFVPSIEPPTNMRKAAYEESAGYAQAGGYVNQDQPYNVGGTV